MEQLKALVKNLTETMTVSGYEKQNANEILALCKEYAEGAFTESYITKSSSCVLALKGDGENRRRLVFDAHVDTIGFTVSQVCGSGYVKLTNLGGIDVNILPSSEVIIYGKEPITGIFSSIPPHLSKDDKLPAIDGLFVDTGIFDDKTLRELIDIGTPAVMYPYLTSLLNNCISATGLDDKICMAAILHTLKLLKDTKLSNTDIYCFFSSGEERGGNGSYHLFNEINPDACIVLDVNFAKEKNSVQGEYGVLGKGSMLSISSTTHKGLTALCKNTAKKHALSLQTVLEMTGTGTNADIIPRTGKGIPCAVISIPLRYMHSSVECVNLDDTVSTAKLLAKIAEEYDKNPVGCPVYHKGGAGGEL